jgi:hypothetical protein
MRRAALCAQARLPHWMTAGHALPQCTAMMYCQFVLPRCTATTYGHNVLPSCTVILHCRDVLRRCAMMYCRNALPQCTAAMLCHDVLPRCAATTGSPHLHVMPRCAASTQGAPRRCIATMHVLPRCRATTYSCPRTWNVMPKRRLRHLPWRRGSSWGPTPSCRQLPQRDLNAGRWTCGTQVAGAVG